MFRLFVFASCFLFGAAVFAQEKSTFPWVVSAPTAKTLIAKGAIVLDTRGKTAFFFRSLKGSQRVDWRDFSVNKKPDRGELLSDGALTPKLRKLGINGDDPVLVVGDPTGGWGEDGRIVWMLRAVGHTKAALIDGGIDAAVQAGIETGSSGDLPLGSFTAQNRSFSVDAFRVHTAMTSDVQIVDVRELREFNGKTPYGEKRGGHVPSATHLYYKDFIDSDGKFRSKAFILNKLKKSGIDPKKRVVAYCTGGVRSAWFVVMLRSLGIDGANYAGSMWQWSAGDASDFPLNR